MKKISCGALLYSIHNNKIIILLGKQGKYYFPFKGGVNNNETEADAARREVFEETCGVVDIEYISLDHIFSTAHKIYKIGIYKLHNYENIINDFNTNIYYENRPSFLEIKNIKAFDIKDALVNSNVHSIAKKSIQYYFNTLLF